MEDPVRLLSATVEELKASVRALEARVAALETSRAEAPPAPALPAAAESPSEAPLPASSGPGPAEAGLPRLVALAGRGLVLLGGAYLFRALTEAHVLPAAAGVTLGLLYAAALLVLEDRAAATGDAAAATAYAAVSTAVVCPIAWEATTRLGVFGAGTGLAVLGGAGAALLVEAARRRLQAAAWLAVLGSLGSAFAILLSSFALEAVLAFLILAGTLAVVVATLRGWPGLAWPAALAADLLAVQSGFILGRASGMPEDWASARPGLVASLLVALALLSLLQTVVRTVLLKAEPELFDFVQPSLAVLTGVGAAAAIGPRAGLSPAALGLGVLAVAAALLVLDTLRPVSRPVSALHTATGAVFVVAGGFLAVPAAYLAAFWSATAVAAALAFLRVPGRTRAVQTAVFVVASSFAAGLLPGAARLFFGTGQNEAQPFLTSALPALVAAFVSWGALASRLAPGPYRFRKNPTAAVAGTIAILDIATLAEGALQTHLVGPRDLGGGSALRTLTISAAAVLLAALRRRRFAAPLGYVVYPLLAVAGLRIVLYDLRYGRPSTLFLTFAVYGAALIFAPRLLRAASTGVKSAPEQAKEARLPDRR
ncbi:MAG: hypothetical protein ACM3JH_02855 [Acidithiobacillales bacterium]